MEIVHVRGVFRNFLREGHQFSSLYSNVFFSAELFLSNLSAKNDSKRVRGHAPPENF